MKVVWGPDASLCWEYRLLWVCQSTFSRSLGGRRLCSCVLPVVNWVYIKAFILACQCFLQPKEKRLSLPSKKIKSCCGVWNSSLLCCGWTCVSWLCIEVALHQVKHMQCICSANTRACTINMKPAGAVDRLLELGSLWYILMKFWSFLVASMWLGDDLFFFVCFPSDEVC